ncbi:unnamed protein product [Owenia fusiformis]|uniref:Uncharacterized protein n=1 Tax=Owenia fusiformis TaxID=6347 RepID=A0A8J1US70_OWEFU|nr:unnamed protein product [Owenia fusiformis]
MFSMGKMRNSAVDLTQRLLLLLWGISIFMVPYIAAEIGSDAISSRLKNYNNTDESTLRRQLMKDYDKLTRPRSDAQVTVDVDVSLWLWQIKELDEKNQILKTFGWLRFVWIDEFLQWKPEEFSNITELILPAQELWLPDVNLGNSANKLIDSSFYEDFRVDLAHTGEVLWSPGGSFDSACALDVTFFPFDSQICTLRFANWMYHGFHQNLSSKSGVVLAKYTENGEWNIVSTDIVVFNDYFQNKKPYPTADFILFLKRKPRYHIVHIVVPCIILTILVTFVFLLPPEAGEKVSMGITVLLSFSVFLLMVAEQIPKTSDSTPLLALYLAAVMTLSASSIILTVIILQMHHHDAIYPVPRWLRYFAFEMIARVVCLRHYKSFSLEGYIRVSKHSSNNVSPVKRGSKMDGRKNYGGSYTHGANNQIPISEEIIDKSAFDSDNAKWKKEWQTVAQILDRFLLFVYLVVLLIFCVVLLFLPVVAANEHKLV